MVIKYKVQFNSCACFVSKRYIKVVGKKKGDLLPRVVNFHKGHELKVRLKLDTQRSTLALNRALKSFLPQSPMLMIKTSFNMNFNFVSLLLL